MKAPALTAVRCCECELPAVSAGRCARCYQRHWRSAHYFDGLRDAALRRDSHACRVCREATSVVHHRRHDGTLEGLITLCPACHARIHHWLAVPYGIPGLLWELWAEQHPRRMKQLQFGFIEPGWQKAAA